VVVETARSNSFAASDPRAGYSVKSASVHREPAVLRLLTAANGTFRTWPV
jgi:hypothetical protein